MKKKTRRPITAKRRTKVARRDQWLARAAAWIVRMIEAAHGEPMPAWRVALGWTSSGSRSNVLGECWHSICTDDQTKEVFVLSNLSPARMIDVLIHEFVHVALPDGTGHKAPFKRLAEAVGLEGPMTATKAGAELQERIERFLAANPYPTTQLNIATIGAGTGDRPKRTRPEGAPKKQGTRMVKCQCAACGYIARTTGKWLEAAGAPLCPCNAEPMEIG